MVLITSAPSGPFTPRSGSQTPVQAGTKWDCTELTGPGALYLSVETFPGSLRSYCVLMQWDLQLNSHLINENRRVSSSWSGRAGCERKRIEFLSSAFIQTHVHVLFKPYRRGDGVWIFPQGRKNQKHYQFKPGDLMKLLRCKSKCSLHTVALLLFPQERLMQQLQVILEE